MERLTPKHGTPSDFTSQISMSKLGHPSTIGSFGAVYRYTINTSEGTKEAAVKVFNINLGRAVEKYEKAMRRELEVWLKLSKHQTIVPLLGIADVGFPLPALVSQWMPSGTLYMYLKQGTITASAKDELVIGVAEGLKYLHSEDVVHGDLHPANVLIDGSGNPRLIDFGLATVTGNAELQLNTTTAGRSFNPQWRAPEVIGIHSDEEDPVRPNFKSDVYSFGGVMFFIISGDPPWKEKKNPHQIIAELLKKAAPARPNNIPDDYWNLIQQCWSWEPRDRPVVTKVIGSLAMKKPAILAKTESTIRTTMSHSTTRTIHPEAAARTKYGTTSPSDITELPDRHLPRRDKNIVVFAESGAGQRPLVNLMAEKEVASFPMQYCTMQWTEHTITFDGDSYKVFDTVGLNDIQLGIREYLEYVENAYRLIKKLDSQGGIDLLLFCIRGDTGRFTPTIQSNYRLFHEFLCERKVPIVLAITNLEREATMENWWRRHQSLFDRYGIHVDGHACITTVNRLDGRYQALYNESRIMVRNLVQQFTADSQKPAWTGGDNLFVSSMRKLKELLSVGLRVRKKDLVPVLTERCGISLDVAKQLAKMISRADVV